MRQRIEMEDQWLVCVTVDGAPAVFRDLTGAPANCIILFSWGRSDEAITADCMALRRAGYEVRAQRVTSDRVQQWAAKGFVLLIDPPLVETARIVDVSEIVLN